MILSINVKTDALRVRSRFEVHAYTGQIMVDIGLEVLGALVLPLRAEAVFGVMCSTTPRRGRQDLHLDDVRVGSHAGRRSELRRSNPHQLRRQVYLAERR